MRRWRSSAPRWSRSPRDVRADLREHARRPRAQRAPLKRVGGVFYNLAGAHTNDALQAIEREMAPILAKHRNAIFMNEPVPPRGGAARRRQAIGLSPEEERSRPLSHDRQGRCAPAPDAKSRLAAITERLASLGTQFSQNVLADEKAYALVLDGEADLAGLPSSCGRPPLRRPRSSFPAST